MEALWLSFAQDSRAGAKRFDAEDGGLFSWPEFLQGRNDLVVFAADGKTVQLMDAGPRIDDYCSGL